MSISDGLHQDGQSSGFDSAVEEGQALEMSVLSQHLAAGLTCLYTQWCVIDVQSIHRGVGAETVEDVDEIFLRDGTLMEDVTTDVHYFLVALIVS